MTKQQNFNRAMRRMALIFLGLIILIVAILMADQPTGNQQQTPPVTGQATE